MPKNERRYLSLEEKVDVIKKRENGISERNVAFEYGCSKTQINQVMKNKESILKDWAENRHLGSRVVKRRGNYEDINAKVYRWYCKMKINGIRVTGPMLKKKALELAESSGIDTFRASNGWLYNFRLVYNIALQTPIETETPDGNVTKSGELERVQTYEWTRMLSSLLQEYELHNIYCLDVTGLIFRNLPTKKLTVTSKLCKNGGMAKERLTVMLCSNCTGEKLPPVIIGKPKRPEFLNAVNSDLTWFHHSKSLVNCDIFLKWLQDFDFKLGLDNRKIMLFIDNPPCSISELALENIKAQLLPANASNCLNPFDLGITKNFKLNYRKNQLEYIIARENSEEFEFNSVELAKKTLILDAIRWVKKAWEDVTPAIIEKCFNICGFTLIETEVEEVVYETDLELLARKIGIEFDELIFDEESQLECFDIANEIKEEIDMDVETKEEGIEEEKIKEILFSLDKIQKTLSKSGGFENKAMVVTRLMDLKNEVEKEIVRKKSQEADHKCIILEVMGNCEAENFEENAAVENILENAEFCTVESILKNAGLRPGYLSSLDS